MLLEYGCRGDGVAEESGSGDEISVGEGFTSIWEA